MHLFLLLLSAVFPLALDASVLEGPVERGRCFPFSLCRWLHRLICSQSVMRMTGVWSFCT